MSEDDSRVVSFGDPEAKEFESAFMNLDGNISFNIDDAEKDENMDDSFNMIQGDRGSLRDSVFLSNLIDNKIKEKVDQKKKTNHVANLSDFSLSNFEISHSKIQNSYLDYTMNQSKVLVKRTDEEAPPSEHDNTSKQEEAKVMQTSMIQNDEEGSRIEEGSVFNMLKDVEKDYDQDEALQSVINIKKSYTSKEGFKEDSEIESKPMKKNRRENSRLSMIDAMHAKKVSTGNIGDLKKQNEDDRSSSPVLTPNEDSSSKNENEGNFENLDDASLNQTVMDGSVIIHSGTNPNFREGSLTSFNLGDMEDDEGLKLDNTGNDRNSYYEANDTSMNTQLNISCFDNPVNTSVIDQPAEIQNEAEVAPKPEANKEPDIESKPLVERGGFAMLRQRLKENAAREREEKMRKNIAESEARRDKVEEKNFNENPDGNEIDGDSSQNSTLTFKEPSFDKKLNSSPNFGQKKEKSPEKKLKSIDSQGLEEDESNSSSQAPDFGISGKKEEEKFPISPPSNHGTNAKVRNSSQLSEYTISNKDAYLVYQSRVDDSNLMSLMNGTIDDDKVHLEWRKIIDDEGNRSHGGLEDRSMINHFRAMKQAPVNPYSSSMIKHYNIASGIGIHSKDRMTEAKSELMAYSANDIILQLLLLGVDKKYNMHITCDYELKECENTFQEMCKRYSYCPEAYFGLGKIYFSKNLTKKALEMFELALKGPKRDTVYCLWAAMTCFYLYIHSEKKEKVTYMKKIEKYCTECLESNIKDTNALFILLMATHDSIENLKSTRFKPSYVPEDIAIRIKEADNYKGYLAWVEIHLHQKDTEFAFQVLDELIEYYPERPESYFKLLNLFEKKSEKACEIAEKLFLSCVNFHMLETKILISIIYAQFLFRSYQYIQCFEFLQNEYTRYPVYPVFLYYYAKYVVMSEEKGYYGSGIGCLQECKRVCIKERNPYINFYMGKYYKSLQRPGKCYPLFTKAHKEFKSKGIEIPKIKEIDKYLVRFRKFTKIIETCKKILKEYKKHQKTAPSGDDKMINDLNSMKELDPITIGLLKSDYYKKILLDKKSSIKEIKILMKNHPDNEEAYFEYWSIIKEKGDIDKLEVISNKLEKVCSSNNVPINSWVNSLFKRSEMMVLKGNKYTNPQDRFDPNGVYSNFIEEAIKALKKISASLPPLPLPALLTIEDPIKIKEDLLDNLNLDERKLSKESETKSKDQDAYELETSFLGFNIRKITAKNTDFGSILSKSDGRSRASDNSDAEYKPLLCKKTSGSTPGHNYTPQTPSTPAGHQYPNSKHFTPRIVHDDYSNRSSTSSNAPGMFSRFPRSMMSVSARESFLGKPFEQTQLDESNIDIRRMSEGFAVNSDVKFLYQIGKICAESGKYLEEGIKCLDDYINLLTFFDPSVSASPQSAPVTENPTFSKAIFFVGIIFDQIGDYTEAKRFLKQALKGLEKKGEEEKLVKCKQILSRIS